MTCEAWDVVAVPFPFTDGPQTINRPALVLSRRNFNLSGHSVMAMITDQRNMPWPLDIPIDFQAAGLKLPSVVRIKLFTLDNQLILKRVGRLTVADRHKVWRGLVNLLPDEPS